MNFSVENRLLGTLFGLAFWEQIFMPVPGAFVNAYQDVPLDMYTDEFYVRRRDAIDARLASLSELDLSDELRARFERFHGYSCRWVDWRGLSAELVSQATRTMPARHLMAIWRRMLFDPRENRSGLPDLIALADGRYCLIEVKGPGDALQRNQMRWLAFFSSEGIPAKVARVSWIETDDDAVGSG